MYPIRNHRARRLRDLAPLFVLFAECEARSPRSRMSLNFDDEDATGMEADDENAAPSRSLALIFQPHFCDVEQPRSPPPRATSHGVQGTWYNGMRYNGPKWNQV